MKKFTLLSFTTAATTSWVSRRLMSAVAGGSQVGTSVS